MQESRVDDCWNIDGSRDLSDFWTCFTQFTLLSEKPPEGYMWSGRIQARSFMARTLVRISKKCQEKHKWAIEKPKLDKTNDFKSKFACILEASESTRMRLEDSLPKYHEDHIAGKGDTSLQHYNLVHNFFLMPQAMKIPAAKAAVDKESEKLEKIPAWDITKVRNKTKVIEEQRIRA